MRHLFNISYFFNLFIVFCRYLEKGLITGVHNLASRYLSELDNIVIKTTFDYEYCNSTEDEVRTALEKENLKNKFESFRYYYGSNYPGERRFECVYNFWSISNSLSMKKLKPYWIKTGKIESHVIKSIYQSTDEEQWSLFLILWMNMEHLM